jgi:hypothetical protein
LNKTIYIKFTSAVLLYAIICNAQTGSSYTSLLYNKKIPQIISMLCKKTLSSDSLRILFNTDSIINDTSRNLSIWNLWYSDPSDDKMKPYWELHVNGSADSAMVIISPPQKTTLLVLKKKLRNWDVVGLAAIKDYHSNFRNIVSANKPIVASLVYGNRVASIAIVFPIIQKTCK